MRNCVNHYILRLIKLIIMIYTFLCISIKISRLKVFSFYCIGNILNNLLVILLNEEKKLKLIKNYLFTAIDFTNLIFC